MIGDPVEAREGNDEIKLLQKRQPGRVADMERKIGHGRRREAGPREADHRFGEVDAEDGAAWNPARKLRRHLAVPVAINEPREFGRLGPVVRTGKRRDFKIEEPGIGLAPHDDPRLNQLDDKTIGLIVDWLRGDWVVPETNPTAE